MTVFAIGPSDEKRLKDAIMIALEHPVPWEIVKTGISTKYQETDTLTLAEREGLSNVPRHIEDVILPYGWRVAISCEEQPAGILLHISMSSPKKGKIPNEHAMKMLIEACGYKLNDVARGWLEEFEPGWNAINILILTNPDPSKRIQ
jgi:hypothetical protein